MTDRPESRPPPARARNLLSALFILAVVLLFAHLYVNLESVRSNVLGVVGLLLLLTAVAVFLYLESRDRRIASAGKASQLLRLHAEKALKAAHREIESTKKYLEGLINSSTDAIIATDRGGSVVLFNTGAEALLGFKREEIIGQSVTALYNSEEFAKGVMRHMRQGGGKVTAFETLLKTRDDKLIPVLLSASILYNEEGEETGTVGFSKDLRERKEIEFRLEELATTDPLTGLYNRNYFTSKLEEEFQRAVRYDYPLSLMILDIDYFKSVNDTYGHNAGDAYLRALSELVSNTVRRVDTTARYGGEELVVILPHTKHEDAMVVAERLRQKVEDLMVHFDGNNISRTVSIGVTTHPEVGAEDADDLLKVADSALYVAKGKGRNFVFFQHAVEG